MVLKTKSLFCALMAYIVAQGFAFGYPDQYKGPVKILRPCPNGSSCDGAYGWASGVVDYASNNITTLGGSVGSDVYKGTWGDNDEGAVVLLTMTGMPSSGSGRGVEVRPVQFQGGNQNGQNYTWIRLMDSGTKTARFYNTLQEGCDSTDYTSYFGGDFLMTTGANRPERFQVYGTSQSGIVNGLDAYSTMTVFAAKKILQHGVIMTTVTLYADTDKSGRTRYSGIEKMKLADGVGQVFCAKGYEPKGNDCVKKDAFGYCQTPPEDNLCEGWSKDWYRTRRGSLVIPSNKSSNNCYQYYCNDPHKGFKSTSDHTCVDCGGVRSGRNADGTCHSLCPLGESYRVPDYYKDGQCKKDIIYTKTDMMYGKGKTENSSTFEASCWPKREAALYRQCVPQGGGRTINFRRILNVELKEVLPPISQAVNASVVLK